MSCFRAAANCDCARSKVLFCNKLKWKCSYSFALHVHQNKPVACRCSSADPPWTYEDNNDVLRTPLYIWVQYCTTYFLLHPGPTTHTGGAVTSLSAPVCDGSARSAQSNVYFSWTVKLWTSQTASANASSYSELIFICTTLICRLMCRFSTACGNPGLTIPKYSRTRKGFYFPSACWFDFHFQFYRMMAGSFIVKLNKREFFSLTPQHYFTGFILRWRSPFYVLF